MNAIDSLRTYLTSLPAGPVSDTSQLETLLANGWDDLHGGGAEGMAAWKLRNRMTAVRWQSPILQFEIERHGGTVMGSTRAERQQWSVDLTSMTADCTRVGHRQVRPMQSRLDVRPIADEISRAITTRQRDERLKWARDGSVRVLIRKILPPGSAVAQTLRGRRDRLQTAIDERMHDAGWTKIQMNAYRPTEADVISS